MHQICLKVSDAFYITQTQTFVFLQPAKHYGISPLAFVYGWLIDCLVDCIFVWLVDCLVDCMFVYLVGWLII